ncbi:non-ribosomal peptide synthetase [Tistrella mobilis]|uniref:Linear gramicidin synthase subunit C n=1 Tax=Tistrella mobilis (strain KA081020-065) TaxID=1110502 RepID=I3TU95_TISMK|nr:non-ribosomal peptide synthetase [Tistrella mobilis]AFK56333.1 Linear gramicidin synthase subunit C [Tistrella mobilis KA081020-065]
MTMDSHHRHDDAPEATPAAPVASFRDKSNVAEIFYLSELQQGMLAHALKGGDDAYHIRHVFEIAGNFDPERFARAWGAVVARHALLRADIRWREIPKPVHIVYRRTAGSLAMADWRGLDPAAQRARLEADLATARAAGFDFARAADPAVQLIRIADDRWWFTWRFHHVQLDGWSVARILADLLAAYRGEAPAAPAPSFRSHIKWLEGRDLAAADAWWQAELATVEAATPLPPAEGPFSQGHAERIRHLDADTTAALDRLARRAGATLSTLLQAAWGWLLATHAGTDEALFGVTLSGRPADLDGVEQIAGLFINTLPLRVTLDRSLNVTDWLAAAQRRMNALRPHDHVPLARIRGLAPLVDGPLFDTILVVENFPVDAALGAADDDVTIRVPGPAAPEDGVIATDGRNHYPLSLIAETGPRLKLVLAYNLSRYGHDDIARLMAQLVRVLEALPVAADRPLGCFAPFDDMPRQPLPALPQLLPDHLRAHDPAAVAIVDGARAITYGDLARDAARLAFRLGALGVRPGDRVALIAPRSAGFVAAVPGIWRAGAAYVPLDPAAPAARLADQIADCGARLVIGRDGDLPADPAGWGEDEAPAVALDPACEAYVIFTSGSTGRPKGIAVSHGALAAYLDGLVARLSMGRDPLRIGWVSTPAADLGHTALFGALRLGAELHIADEARIFDPDRFGAWMADHAIDLIKIVPGHLAALLDAAEPARVLPRRALVLGGEALTAGLAARIAELAPACRLINHYGPSETTVGVLTDEGGTANAGRHALGRPLGHAAVRILDRAGNPVAPGMAGEIVIGGATLAHGYVGRPGQTAERFIPDAAGLPGARVYLTGDRGRAREDGRIDFLGRLDDQVKIRGYRVEPEEVATVLRGLPGVAAATVIARPDANGRLRLLGYAAGSGLDGARLRQALAERLPDALVPAAVMVLDRLPLTPNGKIDRKALPDEPGAEAAAAPAKPAPRTATEAALLAIWCQVLKRDDIGVTDNFFASGGDSILSLQLVARARKAGLKLTPKQVFDQPEIARLAALIDGATPAATPAPTARPQAPRLPAAQVAALEALRQSGVGQSLDGVTDILPATPVQRGMIFHTLEAAGRADGAGVYVNQLRLTFRGRVDLEALEAAWAAAIARHPALRTRFEWRHGGDLLQIVHEAAAAPIAVLDWSSLPAAAARLEDWLAGDIARGIDLTRAPAMRLAVIRRPDGGDELVWTNHHAITDGWSTSLVLAELARDYAARLEGGSAGLPAPPHTRAYAAWLAAQPDPEPWWRRQIARIDQPARITEALITEALAAPAEATPRHHQLRVLLDPDITGRLTAAARREQVTLNTLVQGAWALLLGRYGGRDQAVFGVTLAGRPAELPGVEAMAGAFLNTLPVWIDLPADAAIGPWLRDIQKLNAELRSVEFSSLADVQRWSGLAGEGLFDALLVFQNFPVEAALADLETRLGVTGADAWTRSHYPLELMVVPGDRLDLRWNHDAARLGDAQVAQLHRHFLRLLDLLAEGEGVLGRIDMLDADDCAELVLARNRTAEAWDLDCRIHDLIAPWIVRSPDAPAVIAADGRVLDHAGLDAAANRLAHRLQAAGTGADDVVGLCLPRGPEAVIAMLAVMKAGGAWLPLDPALPDDRLAYMVKTAGARLVIAPAAAAARFPALAVLPPDGGDHPSTPPVCPATPDTLAYVIFTSGSTGRPKGVMIPHRGAVNYLRYGAAAYMDADTAEPGRAAGAGAPVNTALGFDATITSLFLPLVTGRAVHLLPETDEIEALAALLSGSHDFSLVKLTPAHVEALNHLNPAGAYAGQARALIIGGEALTAAAVAPWLAEAPATRLINEYGPTETVVGCAVHRVTAADLAGETMPIGRPIANTRLLVLDDDLRPLPDGAAGGLYIGGAGLARGYAGRPGLTAERFLPDPFHPGERLYRTGDLARWRADGSLDYLGRLDDQVKIRGHRIEPGEIQAVLAAHPAVARAAVIARPGPAGGLRLLAYAVATAGEAADPAALLAHLSARLPHYMVPAQVMLLDDLPLTANGKLDRRALPDPDRPAGQGIAAGDPLEAALLDIWQGVLNRRDIGVTDDFFDLGGDSIMSLQVVARAARAGIRITARQIFDHPRIDRLAAAARSAEAEAAEAEIADTPLPLTPIQAWFFDRHPDGPGHWNQSVLLRSREAIDIAALDRALKAIVARHDALRLRFETDVAGRWRQRVAEIETADLLRVARLDGPDALDAAGDAVQASLDIRTGPLLRAGCFSLPPRGTEPGSDRLLIAIHHLAVDGVSWRILLDDLQAAYDAALAGRPIDLPAPPVPWSRHVLRQAARLEDTAALGAELRWWQGHLAGAAPVWGPARSGDRLEQERVVAEAVTRRLLTDVPRRYRITVEEVLLASLARTLGQATGRHTVLVAMEGHGRGEPGEGGEAHDLSRTIGWFTTHYDLALPAGSDEGGADDARLLADLRSRLRSLPARGADRGLLALAADPAIVEAARALPAADIGFNWLGRFDGSLEEGGRFALGTETAGRNIGRRGPMRHAIEINAAVTDGRLRIGWRHDPAVVAEAVMTRIVEGFEAALTDLVSHCLTADPIPVAADFPLAALDEDGFNRLQLAPGQTEDIYPATPVQQGLLFHSLRHPGQGVYVNQLRVTLDGTPDIDALGRAFAAAMTRHPVLRTSFDWRHGGTALQLVHRRVTLPIDVHDWSGRVAYEPDLADWLAADRAWGFDPSAAPLMRLALFRRPDGAHDLVWTLHHALTDGWSTARLLHEIARDYEALTEPEPAEAGIQAPTPYRDYIAWLLRQPDPAPWWRAQAARIADPAGITQVLAAPAAPVAGSHRLDRPAPEALTRAVEALARRERVTLATVLQGAWALLLGRMAGRGQAGFGLTVSGRPADLPGVERMAGPFINSLPLWIDLPPAARLGDWLRDIQKLNVEMRAVEHSSLADIQRLTGRSGDGLFDSLLVIESYPVETAAGATRLGARTRAMSMVERTHYPLVLAALPGARLDRPGAALDLRWGWDGARLDGDAVARLADDFLDLLGAFTAPDAGRLPLGAVSVTAPVPAPAVVHDVHPVHERFAAIAARMPDREAVACGDRRLDYGQLDRWSSRIARALLAAGVQPETRIGLAVERSVGLVAAILGALRSGGAYVPLDPDYPADRLRHMIADAGLTVLLVGPEAARMLAQVVDTIPDSCRLIDVTTLDDLDAPDSLDDGPVTVPVLPDQLAYVIYTSGSTGLPKGVGISHAALSRHFDDFIPAFAYGPEDAGLQFSTVNFDAAIEQMLPLLTLGGRVVLRGPEMWSAEELTRVLATERLTIADIPTGFWQHWARDPSLHLPHLRRVTVGGEALPPDALARWKAGPLAHVRLDNRYGPTEAAISALYHETRAEDGARPPVPIGRTYPGRSAVILGTDGNPVPTGGIGELCIGGAALARGYLNRPGQTAERFVPDPFGAPGARLYRSGDLCRLREDGVVVFLGRVDAQVKLRGFRIEPGEIEALLRARPGVSDAVVAVRGDRLLAWVAADAEIDPMELRADLAGQLPGWMVPQRVIRLDALPLQPSGKIDLAALPEPETASEAVAPRNALEARLLGLWQKVLASDGPGVTDDFFAVGGDSLKALRLAAAARAEGLDGLSLEALFETPTVAGLARRLAREADETTPPEATPPAGLRCLNGPAPQRLFCIHPGYGLVREYRHLAAALDGRVEVWGLQAPRLSDPAWAPADMAALARDYLARLRLVQPEGGLHLAGWSLGGWLAAAIAAEADREGGQGATTLTIIDTPSTVPSVVFDPAGTEARIRGYLAAGQIDDLAAEAAAGTGADDRDTLVAAAVDLVGLHARLLTGWVLPRLAVPVSLLRATAAGRALDPAGWHAAAPAGLTLHDLDADHEGILAHPDTAALVLHTVTQATPGAPA